MLDSHRDTFKKWSADWGIKQKQYRLAAVHISMDSQNDVSKYWTLQTYSAEQHQKWDQALPQAEFVYNSTYDTVVHGVSFEFDLG